MTREKVPQYASCPSCKLRKWYIKQLSNGEIRGECANCKAEMQLVKTG